MYHIIIENKPILQEDEQRRTILFKLSSLKAESNHTILNAYETKQNFLQRRANISDQAVASPSLSKNAPTGVVPSTASHKTVIK